MQLKQLSLAIGRALVGAGAVLCATLPLVGSGQQAASGYTVPRTAWGDPDLTGKWPGTDMVGVPMQRDEKLGLRNVLTDEEFAERERARSSAGGARQRRLRARERGQHAGRRRRRGRVPSSALARARRAAAPSVADRRSAERPHAAVHAAAQERTGCVARVPPDRAAPRTRTRTAATTTAASRAASRARSCPSSTTTARRSSSRRAT